MKTDTDVNLQLRSEILDIALNLEHSVNDLLLLLLLIENENRKAISNKSGNLSFKNKIDLLFDLDILTSDEYQKFLLLMEFRNQFLHNIECCSFEDALRLLGVAKEKKLLKFDDQEEIIDKEYRYQNAFRNLNIECWKILCKKIEDRKNQLEDRRKALLKLIDGQIFFINRYFDMIKKVIMVCEEHDSEIPQVTKLITQLKETVTKAMESLSTSEELIQIQDELKELLTPERIKATFGR